MSNVRDGAAVEAWSFDRDAMVALGTAHAQAYATARPFPHVVVDGLLGDARSAAIARAFPAASHPGWKRREHAEQARLTALPRSGFVEVAAEVRWLLAELGSLAFLDFLAALTGQRDLIADPHYLGARPMLTTAGGHLALHIDFNRDSRRHLDRAVTALYYAPVDWDDAWGGELELWDAARTRCEATIAPRRDRLVVMAFGEANWHGHPAALRCPDGVGRAVVAAYFYRARAGERDDDGAHGARW